MQGEYETTANGIAGLKNLYAKSALGMLGYDQAPQSAIHSLIPMHQANMANRCHLFPTVSSCSINARFSCSRSARISTAFVHVPQDEVHHLKTHIDHVYPYR